MINQIETFKFLCRAYDTGETVLKRFLCEKDSYDTTREKILSLYDGLKPPSQCRLLELARELYNLQK